MPSDAADGPGRIDLVAVDGSLNSAQFLSALHFDFLTFPFFGGWGGGVSPWLRSLKNNDPNLLLS